MHFVLASTERERETTSILVEWVAFLGPLSGHETLAPGDPLGSMHDPELDVRVGAEQRGLPLGKGGSCRSIVRMSEG